MITLLHPDRDVAVTRALGCLAAVDPDTIAILFNRPGWADGQARLHRPWMYSRTWASYRAARLVPDAEQLDEPRLTVHVVDLAHLRRLVTGDPRLDTVRDWAMNQRTAAALRRPGHHPARSRAAARAAWDTTIEILNDTTKAIA